MSRMSRAAQALGLVVSLLVSFATAGVGSLASLNAASFYAQLVQPPWAPPAWLFGPVWTLLFVLIAVAAWLVWRTHGFRTARAAWALFAAQLLANALWSWLFFAWRQGALAFAEVLLLWGLIVMTITTFWRLHHVAALLLLPYLAWVSFATVLSYTLWRLNPVLLG